MCDRLLDSVCRLCLKDNLSLDNIFTYRCHSGEILFELLEKIYDLKICEGDGFPSQACVACLWKVLEFDMYRKNVKYAETEFKNLLSRTYAKSNEVSVEGTDKGTEFRAERKLNVASDLLHNGDNHEEVFIKNEDQIEEWEMPQNIPPHRVILENIEFEAGEDVVKETEVSVKDIIEIEEEEREAIQPEKDTLMDSTGNDFEHNYPEHDVQTEESEELQVSIKNENQIEEWEMPQLIPPHRVILENIEFEAGEDVVKETEVSVKDIIKIEEEEREAIQLEKDPLMDSTGNDFEHNYPEHDVQTEELEELQFSESRKNKEMCEKNFRNDLFSVKESFFHLKCKSCYNTAAPWSSSSEIPVQSKRIPFVCDVCKKCWDTKQRLARHVRIHYDDRPFKCVECGKSFKQKSTKVVHELRHVKQQKENEGDKKRSTEKSFVCEICKKECNTRHSLYLHSNLHKNKYSCTFCGRRCSSKSDLNVHLRIHTNERPFSCEVCKKTFIRNVNLKKHLVTHSDNRPFHCDFCYKTFKTKDQKNNHELYHLRSK